MATKSTTKKMERRDVKLCEVKMADDESGVFEGYASVFGIEDLQGEIVDRGSFKRTIDHSNGKVPILWQHNPYDPIGVGVEMREDERGLFIKGKLTLAVQKAMEAHALLKDGAIKGMSIGFQTIKDEWSKGIRHLKELALAEYSLVTFPAMPLAQVSGVKEATPFLDTADPSVMLKRIASLIAALQGDEKAKQVLSEDRSVVEKMIGELTALLATEVKKPDSQESHSGDAPKGDGLGISISTKSDLTNLLNQMRRDVLARKGV